MTGAPKIEAMKIIARLEQCVRGIYSGAIGYLDFDGAMDFGVVIRTLIKKGDHLSFHVGGALVADGKEAGYVTRAAFSPELSCPIGMGYVRKESKAPGTTLEWRGGTATVATFPEKREGQAANR